MVVDTKSAVLFFKICILSLIPAMGVGSVFGQLKLELNFGESDNFHAVSKLTSSVQSLSNLDAESGEYDLGGILNPSPAGGDFLILNGINQFLKLPSYLDINLNGHVSYSVSCWIYLYSTGVHGEVINADNGFVSGYRFFIDNNIPKVEITEGPREVFSSEVAIEPAQWTHIGFFCDGAGDSLSFYINGKLRHTRKFEKITQVNTGPQSYIGASIKSSQPNYLKANLDQIRIFAGHDTVFDQVESQVKKPSTRKQRNPQSALFVLDQNYPNPLNLSTKIRFELKQAGYVQLNVYDLLGNAVRTLEDAEMEEGDHEYYWDGTDSRGNTVTSGIYFARLSYDGMIQTKKMILVK
ncbi:MAG: T9SS type A sorting domain-containing protein [Bacteroidetes bacterium]|nr:T9SS type A sorting domain-containing protein [Bacteroidota bacterium]